jgi:hypothetical protein
MLEAFFFYEIFCRFLFQSLKFAESIKKPPLSFFLTQRKKIGYRLGTFNSLLKLGSAIY